jgi:hypothetical protein
VGFELLPHLNRLDQAFLEKVGAYSTGVPHDVLALTDGAAVLQEADGSVVCIGHVERFRAGVRTVIEPGMIP